MKLRKLAVCLLASMVVFAGTGNTAHAAERAVGETERVITEDTADTVTTEENNTTDSASVGSNESTDVEEKKETKEEVTSREFSNTIKQKAAEKPAEKSYTKAELRLLSALIYCESGNQPYAGKLAVGIVVVNRKESRAFPNSINSVVYQKYQFGPARNGSLARALSQYDKGKFTSSSEKECIKAAKEALSGNKRVTYRGKKINMKGYLYFSGRVSGAKLTIGGHQFK